MSEDNKTAFGLSEEAFVKAFDELLAAGLINEDGIPYSVAGGTEEESQKAIEDLSEEEIHNALGELFEAKMINEDGQPTEMLEEMMARGDVHFTTHQNFRVNAPGQSGYLPKDGKELHTDAQREAWAKPELDEKKFRPSDHLPDDGRNLMTTDEAGKWVTDHRISGTEEYENKDPAPVTNKFEVGSLAHKTAGYLPKDGENLMSRDAGNTWGKPLRMSEGEEAPKEEVSEEVVESVYNSSNPVYTGKFQKDGKEIIVEESTITKIEEIKEDDFDSRYDKMLKKRNG